MSHRIKTSFEWPPTPLPPFWRAWSDSMGADDSPYGTGATESEAMLDLMVQLAELEDAP